MSVLTSDPVEPLRSVLVANRGEIAVRILRGAHDAGLHGIAVHTAEDAAAMHVRRAAEAHEIGDYLDIAGIVAVARRSGAQAVHPGYGFLAENAEFAAAVLAAGLVWIGPPPEVIRELGDKVTARQIACEAGVPLLAGSAAPVADVAEVAAFAAVHGLPLLIKAACGGGGRGLRVVRDLAEIGEAFAAARREAVAAFGRGECFVEQFLDAARHVEAQVLADDTGRVVVVGLRDCSVQRRNQKLIEEAPPPGLPDGVASRITDAARAVCRAVGYRNAGTVEFLVATDGSIAFLEVNTRLQVEHPVTEQTTGVDLVAEQFRLAAGAALCSEADVPARCHAIEFRLLAEDPATDFVPTPGMLTAFQIPVGAGVRCDAGVAAGDRVQARYDSMFAKLIVSGPDRATTLRRAQRVLDETVVTGVPTPLELYRQLMRHPDFAAEPFRVHTRWLESLGTSAPPAEPGVLVVRVGRRLMSVEVPGLAELGPRAERTRAQSAALRAGGTAAEAGPAVRAPMRGTIVAVAVKDGDHVGSGDVIAICEAMKMENPVRARRSGLVVGLTVAVGDPVDQGDLLCEIRDPA
jgi:acetyl-CoA/propionyl-CoA carboxylase biotin carboxyl carrier protein